MPTTGSSPTMLPPSLTKVRRSTAASGGGPGRSRSRTLMPTRRRPGVVPLRVSSTTS